VIDLGCGSGLWAQELTKAGYRVLGIDISEQMIAIARKRVPEAEFRVGSLFDADIPPCQAVTAVGEVLNYLFDSKGDGEELLSLFRRVYAALARGGVFVFDLAEPGQVLPRTATRGFTEGEGWVVLLEKEEDTEQGTLTRRIVTFRRTTHCYRRDDEVHRLRLLGTTEVAKQLRQAGFRVWTRRAYGRYRLPRVHAAFVARKLA
jgi:SAM-dependent methyltransferase